MKKVLVLLVVLFATLVVFGQASKSSQDQQACEYARRSSNAEIWQDYLKQFPQGMCAFEARSEIKKLDKNNQNKIGGLHWSSRSSNEMKWYDAVNYCKTLNEGGYSNWRLPTISELRTLIQNCPNTATDGSCGVIDDCTYKGCWSEICGVCPADKSGKYSKLGDNTSIWSSSALLDSAGFVWRVNFGSANVFINGRANLSYVRCVR